LQSPDSSSGFNILLQIKANAHAFRKYSNFIISESKQEIIDQCNTQMHFTGHQKSIDYSKRIADSLK